MLDAIILLLGLAIVLVPRFQKLEKTPIKGGSSELRRGDSWFCSVKRPS
jgi:hypothetical protein